MSASICVLTPTGGRPEAIKALGECIRLQTYDGPVRWLFVDDVDPATEVPEVPGNWTVEVIRPTPRWKKGQNTQARNLRAALDVVSYDERIVILEDDDWIAPWWIERVCEWLDHDDLVGEAPSVYRHLNGNERRMNNTRHASLCATAMKGKAIDRFREVVRTHSKYIDVELWKMGGKLYPHDGGVIGIKGYPGRPGIGIGHRL